MARVQIMHLPAPADPFLLIFDQWDSADPTTTLLDFTRLKEDTGARAVLVFEDTVEVA